MPPSPPPSERCARSLLNFTRVVVQRHSTTSTDPCCQGGRGTPACPKVSFTREFQKIQSSSLVGLLLSQPHSSFSTLVLAWSIKGRRATFLPGCATSTCLPTRCPPLAPCYSPAAPDRPGESGAQPEGDLRGERPGRGAGGLLRLP